MPAGLEHVALEKALECDVEQRRRGRLRMNDVPARLSVRSMDEERRDELVPLLEEPHAPPAFIRNAPQARVAHVEVEPGRLLVDGLYLHRPVAYRYDGRAIDRVQEVESPAHIGAHSAE